jgi:hypothetical protein
VSASQATVACEMELEGADGEARVAFVLRNAGRRPVTLSWFEPFVTFSIDAEVEGAPARIVAGAYDGGVRRVEEVLAPGAERRIATPIRLAFDPAPTLPDRAPPTRWRIVHEPAPTLLRATLALGADRLTCIGQLVPPLT